MPDATLNELARCADALRDPAGPPALYKAVEDALGRLVGHRLFTLLVAVEDGSIVERVWSSDRDAYPLTGRKAMGPTPWGDHVLKGQKPWLGNDPQAIRWAFPDHAVIEGLGLGACINIPVVAFGRTLGTVNLLHRAGAYEGAHVPTAGLFAALLALPFARASAEIGAGERGRSPA